MAPNPLVTPNEIPDVASGEFERNLLFPYLSTGYADTPRLRYRSRSIQRLLNAVYLYLESRGRKHRLFDRGGLTACLLDPLNFREQPQSLSLEEALEAENAVDWAPFLLYTAHLRDLERQIGIVMGTRLKTLAAKPRLKFWERYHTSHPLEQERVYRDAYNELNLTRWNNQIVLDLFSGAGGFSLGFQKAGLGIRAMVENDPAAVETYEFHHPGTDVYQTDIEEFIENDLQNFSNREIQIIIGGPPCKGFSAAGLREGYLSKNDKIREFMACVRHIKPKVAVMENVPPINHGRNKPYFDKYVKETLEKMGYTVSYSVIFAADSGVPQRRPRLIVVGTRNDGEPKPFLFPSRSFAAQQKLIPDQYTTVKQALSPLCSTTRFSPKKCQVGIPNGASVRWVGKKDKLHIGTTFYQSRLTNDRDILPIDPNDLAPTIRAGSNGIPYFDMDGYAKKFFDFMRVIGTKGKTEGVVYDWDEEERNGTTTIRIPVEIPAGTEAESYIRCLERKTRPLPDFVVVPPYEIHKGLVFVAGWTVGGPEGIIPGTRRLTETEALVLQGFPADYMLAGNSTQRWSQIGNAVPPPMSETIAREIVLQGLLD